MRRAIAEPPQVRMHACTGMSPATETVWQTIIILLPQRSGIRQKQGLVVSVTGHLNIKDDDNNEKKDAARLD